MTSAAPATGPTAPPGDRLAGVYLVYGALFCVFWSSSFSVTKIALIDCPPLVLLAARFAVAGLILLAIAVVSGPLPKMTARDYGALVVSGLALHAIHLGFGYSGVNLISAGFAAMLFSTSPILVAVASAVFLRERLTSAKLVGFVLGFVGVAIVLRSRLADGIENPLGAAFVMIGALSLVVGTILYKRLMPAGGLWYGQAVQFLASAVFILPVMFLVEDVSSVTPTTRLFLAFVFIVFITAIGTYSLWLYLVSRTSASAASSLLFLTPPLGLLFGWLVLGEPVAIGDLIGVIPIAIGIRLVTRG